MQFTPAADAPPVSGTVRVRPIDRADLSASLAEGWDDFKSKRGDLLFIGLLYPVIGLVTAWISMGAEILPLVFPLAAGLSLLGPLVSTGFYELARRRERGVESSWWHFLDVFKNPSFDQIIAVGILLIALFGAWVVSAGLIYAAFFGTEAPASIGGFLSEVFTTARGWGMILVGNLVGFVFALIVLAVSVVSLPMLIDKDVDAGTAIGTSIRAVRDNPGPMLRWGATVAGLLALGSLPFFLGLAFVLPVLGYATWHLYTKLVVREGLPDAHAPEAGDEVSPAPRAA